MDSQIDLSVEFVSATQSGGTDVNEAISGFSQSGLAQTGDAFMWAIIAAAIIVACGALAGLMYFRKKRFAISAISSSVKHAASVRGSISSVFGSLFKSTAFVIIASIFAAMLMVAGLSSTFSASAYADANGGLSPSTNKVIATVNEDGSVSFSSISLANNSEDVFTLESSIVSIADEAKSVTALSSSNFTINGFGGIVFSGNPNGQPYMPEDTNKLNPTESTDLSFALSDIDKSSLESLCGKSVFILSFKGKMAPDFPELKENLYEYTADDLRQISDYLGSLSAEECVQDDYYLKFADFRDKGLMDDGTDNGTPMKDADGNFNNFAKYHWAIDSAGRIATDPNFDNNSAYTIQTRIIGIREDVDVNGNKIGLTMMTTHALSATSTYEDDITNYAKYGWAGPTENGSCTLRSNLNSGTLFPTLLKNSVKSAAKAYQYSSKADGGNSLAIDKFWAPSMFELYGKDFSGLDYWSDTTEGKQYLVFENKGINSISNYGFFVNINFAQTGSDCADCVWSRSLSMMMQECSCSIDGKGTHGSPGAPFPWFGVYESEGVVACFCFGTESSPGPTPGPDPEPENWLPMQAQINDEAGSMIDFYPAFSEASQIDGYKFATYDGTNYNEILNINSMSNIYSALQQPSTGEKTTTLYYQKTDSEAQDLMCYTVKDLTWNYVFGTNESGEATAYDQAFINDYQKDKLGNDNGIKTALLESDGFGSGWDVTTPGSIDIPLVNGVEYANNSNTGFYGCYGGYAGGLLSNCSGCSWGCCARYSNSALYFNVGHGNWDGSDGRSIASGVVLARAFGGDSQQSAQVSQNSDINILKNDNSAFKDTKDISDIQTQQSINEPGSVAVNDKSAQKDEINNSISPYEDTNKNTDTGAQPATGQSTGTATDDQASVDSGGAAHNVTALQSAASLNVIIDISAPTG